MKTGATKETNMLKNFDEMEVIKKMKSGNKEAYAVIFNKYRPYLLNRVIQRVMGNRELAEDLVSDIMIKIYEKIDSYNNEEGVLFKTWLTTVANNHVIDHLRKKRDGVELNTVSIDAKVVNDGDDDSTNSLSFGSLLRDTERNVDDINEPLGTKEMVRAAISKLKPKYISLIKMRFFLGLSYEEIADHFQEPIGTVKGNLKRTKDKLAILIDIERFENSARKNKVKKNVVTKLDAAERKLVKSSNALTMEEV